MQAAFDWALSHDPREALAVALALAYLLLAVRQSLWCWYAALASSALYALIFWEVRLYMESALQLYYIAMAAYGWWSWRGGAAAGGALAISTRGWRWHGLALVAVLLAATASGALLARYTAAAWPWADSFTTWGSLLATWMVARKILGNWGWWFVIDSVSLWLYLDRGLQLTAALFGVYLVIIVFGYLRWRRHYREQSSATPAARAR